MKPRLDASPHAKNVDYERCRKLQFGAEQVEVIARVLLSVMLNVVLMLADSSCIILRPQPRLPKVSSLFIAAETTSQFCRCEVSEGSDSDR